MKLADVSIIRLQTLIETYRESKLENGSCWYYVAVEFCLRLLRPLTEMTLNNHPLPPLKTLKGLMEDLERICYHSVKLRAQTDIKSTMKLQAQIRALLLRQINFISSHTWKSSKRNRLAGVQVSVSILQISFLFTIFCLERTSTSNPFASNIPK